MAINYPTALDALTNPIGSNTLASPSHAGQHADANDAIEALQAKVGIDGSAEPTSLEYRVTGLEASGLDVEAVDDRVNALLTAGTGITKTYDDLGGTLTLDVSGLSLPVKLENGTDDDIVIATGANSQVVGPLTTLSLAAAGEVLIEAAYGWTDITADVTVKGAGANDPSWSVFRGGILAYEFSATVMKEAWLNFHPNHDYAPGTDFYLHAHFSPNNTGTGVVRFGFEYSVGKGHGQGAGSVFPATTTVYAEFTIASSRQYEHLIAETAAITDANFEVDSLCLVRVFRDAAHINDTFSGTVHVFTADIHAQKSRFATKNRAPNFYA